MSNIIDSIQLSGVTYGIKGSGGTETIELTQAQYDALVDKDPNVFYIITDAQAGDLTNYYTKTETNTLLGGKADTATTYTKTEVDTALNGKADTATTYTKTETDNAITAATSTKQDTLVSGTNIKTINNTSILGSGNIDIQGGGGKAVSGGTNISITTGETADTINCTLPISAGTGTNSLTFGYDDVSLPQYIPKAIGRWSIAGGVGCSALTEDSVALGYLNKAAGSGGINGNFAQGYMTTASGNRCHSEGLGTSSTADASHSEGHNTTASGNYSHSEGEEVKATNFAEHSQGRYNVSIKASTTFGDSGNTLFSVGNGTSNSARHNAFEIRQNGDIYLTLDGQDVKLQDQLGGSSITVDSALSPTSENPVQNKVLFDELRITESEGSETKLIWEEVGYNDFRTTNFPSGYTTLKVVIKDGQAVGFFFHNSNGDSLGEYNIYNFGGLEVTNGFNGSTYTVDGNNVTITWDASKDVAELGTDGGGEVYDYTAEFYAVDEPVYSALKEVVSGKADTSAVTEVSDALTAHTANTTVHTTAAEKSSWNGAATNASNALIALGGLSLVKLTQAEYDALSPNYDSNTLYVIVN